MKQKRVTSNKSTKNLKLLAFASSRTVSLDRTSTATVIASNSSATAEKPPLSNGLIILACALFVVGAALAAAETAITTLWPWKVRELAEKEGPKSPFSLLESDLTRFLTTILVSTTTATIFATAIATEIAGDILGAAAVGYVTVGLTVFFLFFGEILPKALAVHSPAKVSRIMVPVISTLSVIVYPLGKLLAFASTMILRILKLPMENDTTVSEEELRLIVAGADRSGSIEKHESQIIQNVLDLEETNVREVMCPRVDMVSLSVDKTLLQFMELEAQSHYSRMPVYDHTVDNVVGVVMAKSLLKYLKQNPELLETTTVSEIFDPPFFVPESMSVWIALEEMRRRRLHMAIVVDEYGGTAGLVTLEDILEEVVGEIYDEDDDYEAESQSIERRPDGRSFIIDGQTGLDKVDKELALNLSEDDLHDYGTISGFLCARMGGIPQVGEEVVCNGVRFSITNTDDRRIVSMESYIMTQEELDIFAAEEEAKKLAEEESRALGDLGVLPNGIVSPSTYDSNETDSNGSIGRGIANTINQASDLDKSSRLNDDNHSANKNANTNTTAFSSENEKTKRTDDAGFVDKPQE